MAKKMLNSGPELKPAVEGIPRISRRRRPVRGKAFQVNKMPKNFLKLLDILNPYPEWKIQRPRTRADCAKMPRPCPFVSCRYHRYIDVDTKKRGSQIKLNFPDVLSYEHIDEKNFTDTCILDLAEEGPRTLEEVGQLLNLTRERVRQLESHAIRTISHNEELRNLLKKLNMI